MDFVELTDEQIHLKQMLAAFAANEVRPLAREIDRDQRFPIESWRRGAELGILGVTAPEEFGGTDLGLTELCLIGEELSSVCVSTAATLLHQADLVINRFVRFGDAEQKRTWLPRLCDGSVVGCLAITEPEAGSDALSMTTTACRTSGGWSISGTKSFITNGPDADIALVYARIAGEEGLGLFIVECDRPGFRRGPKLTKMGWRGSTTCELFFDSCEVPDGNLIGTPGQGREILFAGLNSERIVMAAESVGLARGALDAALEYANQRRQFGRTIGEFQMVQQKLADLYSELLAARALVYRAAAMVDAGARDITTLASSCKLLAGELSMRSTTEAVQIFGGYGYTDEFPVERFMRDAKLMTIGGGTSEVMRALIARRLLAGDGRSVLGIG